MGACQYRFNPSEAYQRTGPGQGVETHCGGRTWPAVDEPELLPVTVRDGPDVRTEYRPTGVLLPRAQADPYCPAHGGCAPVDAPQVTYAELEASGRRLAELNAAYVEQLHARGLPVPESLAAALETSAPAEEEVRS